MSNPDEDANNNSAFETFPKIIESVKERLRTEYDLLFMLTYMASISTANLSRQQIFEYTGERDEYVTSKYIKKVNLMAQNLNFEYSKACKIIAEQVSNRDMRDFLGRFSNALSSGETEKEFLRSELDTMIIKYSNKYERDVEALKKWIDGYSALLVSTTLVVMIEVISLVLYNVGNIQSMIKITTWLVLFVGVFGVYILYRSAPREVKTHSLKDRSPEQEKIRSCYRILLPLMFLSIMIFPLIGISTGVLLVVLSILMLPIGVYGYIDDMNLDKRDEDFTTFCKTLGNIAGSSGTTLNIGLSNMQQESLGILNNLVKRMHARMSLGLNDRMCWMKFAGESGSEVIHRLSAIFYDSVSFGGRPEEIGKIVSSSCLSITLQRMKRRGISTTFSGLIIPLHTVMIGVLLFIVGILATFNEMVEVMMTSTLAQDAMTESMPSSGAGLFSILGTGSIDVVLSFATTTVLILTIVDTMAIKVTVGGASYKFCQYGTILFMISGLSLLYIPKAVKMIFTLPGVG